MAWVWWLLAPIASTVLGAIVIWWRTPTETARRRRRADAISEHQALLRALAQQEPTRVGPSVATHLVAADPPVRD